MGKNGQSDSTFAIDCVIARNLQRMRVQRDMTLTQVAERIGLSYQQIQKYENGSNRIAASRLWQFAILYGVEPNDFFHGAPSIVL